MPVTELYAFNLTCVILLMALYGVALKLLHCSCWPINYTNSEELKKYLIENKYQYIKINSSYGMYGWIIAKDYTIKLQVN